MQKLFLTSLFLNQFLQGILAQNTWAQKTGFLGFNGLPIINDNENIKMINIYNINGQIISSISFKNKIDISFLNTSIYRMIFMDKNEKIISSKNLIKK